MWVISFKFNYKVTITDTYYVFGKMTWSDKWEFVKNSFNTLVHRTDWARIFLSSRQDQLNVVAFIPFGLYMAFFSKKQKLLRAVALSLLASLVFEALQLITHIGSFSATDLLTNTLGGTIGYFAYKLLYKDTPRRQRGLCIASVLALVLIVPLVCYAVTRTVGMMDFYLDVLLRRL